MTAYKVGDRGVTRSGQEASCVKDAGASSTYPLFWQSSSGWYWSTTYSGSCSDRLCAECDDDIVRRIDDAKVEPEPAAAEVEKDEQPAEQPLILREGRVRLRSGMVIPLAWGVSGGGGERWIWKGGPPTYIWDYKGRSLSHGLSADIVAMVDDDAKPEHEWKIPPAPHVVEVAKPTCDREPEAICPDPSSTLRTRASFSSDEHVIGGVYLIATYIRGEVSLFIDDKELSEAEAAAVMRTIETVMEQARRAKEVVG